jgi:hypothetical protein
MTADPSLLCYLCRLIELNVVVVVVGSSAASEASALLAYTVDRAGLPGCRAFRMFRRVGFSVPGQERRYAALPAPRCCGKTWPVTT